MQTHVTITFSLLTLFEPVGPSGWRPREREREKTQKLLILPLNFYGFPSPSGLSWLMWRELLLQRNRQKQRLLPNPVAPLVTIPVTVLRPLGRNRKPRLLRNERVRSDQTQVSNAFESSYLVKFGNLFLDVGLMFFFENSLFHSPDLAGTGWSAQFSQISCLADCMPS